MGTGILGDAVAPSLKEIFLRKKTRRTWIKNLSEFHSGEGMIKIFFHTGNQGNKIQAIGGASQCASKRENEKKGVERLVFIYRNAV